MELVAAREHDRLIAVSIRQAHRTALFELVATPVRCWERGEGEVGRWWSQRRTLLEVAAPLLFPKEVMYESSVPDWFGGGGLHRQHRARSCAARRQTPQPPGALKLLAVHAAVATRAGGLLAPAPRGTPSKVVDSKLSSPRIAIAIARTARGGPGHCASRGCEGTCFHHDQGRRTSGVDGSSGLERTKKRAVLVQRRGSSKTLGHRRKERIFWTRGSWTSWTKPTQGKDFLDQNDAKERIFWTKILASFS